MFVVKVTTKRLQETTSMLEDIIKEYKLSRPDEKRDWRTYEQQYAARLKTAMRELEPLIDEAIGLIEVVEGDPRGRPPELTLKQRTLLLFIKHLAGKSNREMSGMLVLFSLLSGVDVSYKTVERLYSDELVQCVLHNMHQLILKRKKVEKPDCAGDGTGYTLTIKKHYATEATKRKEKAKKKDGRKKKHQISSYTFTLLDLDTRLYLAYGTSLKSEKDAYNQAMTMAEKLNIAPESLRLDKYYSNQKDVKKLHEKFPDITFYLIPKINATVRGTWKWKQIIQDFIENTLAYLHQYYRRNQSESAYSEDKRRFGHYIPQKLPYRINTAQLLTTTCHNLLWLHQE